MEEESWDKSLIENPQRSETENKIKISLKEFLSFILCGEIEIDDFEDANLAYSIYYPKTWKSTKKSKSLRTTKKPYLPMSPDLRVCDIIRLGFKANFIVDKNLSTGVHENFFF